MIHKNHKITNQDQFKKDLIDLFEDIVHQTGYMTNSWGDTSMLSQMAIEDQISPWSIEGEIDKFRRKYNIIKKPIQMEFNFKPIETKEIKVNTKRLTSLGLIK